MRAIFAVCVLLVAACHGTGHQEDGDYTTRVEPACESLRTIDLRQTRVIVAESVSNGAFPLENPGYFDPPSVEDLPEFCRISAAVSPVDHSLVGFELWLPANDWNGRLLMLGNGGYSSALPYVQMGAGLRSGYAVVATDTGHDGDDPAFARERPEAIEDWGHRAVHASLQHARTLTMQYFGTAPRYSYFAGCSTGGHQALTAAQRYPDDFDGIIAGAPGHNRTHLNAGFLWQFLRNHKRGAGAETILPAHKLKIISNGSLAACRSNNGLLSGGLPDDPYLDDPLACDFDPASLVCLSEEDADCLTEQEIVVVRALYDGPRNPRTGARIYFGQTPGSETAGGPPALPGWSLYWADPQQPDQPARANFWRYWVFDDPDWDWWSFDFDDDMRITDLRLAPVINAMNPDLKDFQESGGKLIQFHGSNDPVVPVADSISYYERVRARHGRDISDFYRLFLAPGVEHCRGGPGPDSFDMLPALEAWVSQGLAPDRIVATHYNVNETSKNVEFTRPLCPYPEYAEYGGHGSVSSEDSFVCRANRQRPNVPDIGPEYLR